MKGINIYDGDENVVLKQSQAAHRKWLETLEQKVETTGIEPATSRMRSERSTTELRPLFLLT